jgi:hypothetical protein
MEGKVLRLKKALYGLRQAPRAWNAKLHSTLLSLGFTRCPSEHAVYARGDASSRLLIGVYVDDLIITGCCKLEIAKFKREMTDRFKMSDLGMLSYYLGMEVTQGGGKITLCQSAYAGKILQKAGMEDCTTVQVPMEPRLKLSKSSSNPPVDATSTAPSSEACATSSTAGRTLLLLWAMSVVSWRSRRPNT